MSGGSKKNKNALKKAKQRARRAAGVGMESYEIAMHSDYAMELPDEDTPSGEGQGSPHIPMGSTKSADINPRQVQLWSRVARFQTPRSIYTHSAPASVGPSPQYKTTEQGSELPSSLPYPEVTSQVSEMPDDIRKERRAEKSRCTQADSIESDDLKKAAAHSLKDLPNDRENSEQPPTTWVDGNIKAAYETLGCERAARKDSEEFNRRHAALRRVLKSLTNLRVAEDGQMAQDEYQKMLAKKQEKEYIQEAARIDAVTAQAQRRRTASPTLSRSLERAEQEVQDLEKLAVSQRMALESKKSNRSGETSSTQGRSVKVPGPRTSSTKVSSTSEQIDGTAAQGHTVSRSRVTPTIVGSDTSRQQSSVRQFLAPKSGASVISKESDVSVTDESSPRHGLYDRIVLQRVRGEEIAAKGWSGLKDQGIGWDAQGQAFELKSAPSCGSLVGTMGGTRRAESHEFCRVVYTKEKRKLFGETYKAVEEQSDRQILHPTGDR
ncbi:hypothetical protein C8R43DRAFT_963058 [Mycena crocata]|nr:hypothetical protein C8R43DRAFT_963058 [Mycena crocata]